MSGLRSSRLRLATVLGALAALAGAGALLSGCGASTLDPVAQAAQISSRQPGAHVTYSVRISSGAPALGKVQISGTGYLDPQQRAEQMTMRFSGIPGPRGRTLSVPIEAIEIYPDIYMKLPASLTAKLPSGKPWMEINLLQAASAAGISPQLLSTNQSAGPSQYLEYLRASSGDVTTVGQESIDGVPTTRYRASIALRSILSRLPAGQRAGTKAALQRLGEPSTLTVEVWVDAQHRVRRMVIPLHLSTSAATGALAGGVSGTIEVNLTRYGPVPPIAPPPAGKVFNASALIAAAAHRLHR